MASTPRDITAHYLLQAYGESAAEALDNDILPRLRKQAAMRELGDAVRAAQTDELRRLGKSAAMALEPMPGPAAEAGVEPPQQLVNTAQQGSAQAPAAPAQAPAAPAAPAQGGSPGAAGNPNPATAGAMG